MIPEAREVRLSRKHRKVLEGRCRLPVTTQRELKRACIILLASSGHSTRSVASEVGVQPRIVSLWRHRFADEGLDGLNDSVQRPPYHSALIPGTGFFPSMCRRRPKRRTAHLRIGRVENF
ncbi:MAG: helix-turn-helix domain-containing protein [Rhizomicrobium sp.]